jgi:hypothetical protein
MSWDARIDGLIQVNLFDRDFFKPLPTTDTKPSVDPYAPEERETILEAFRTKKPLLQAGMAADLESEENPTSAFLQHAPQLREFSLLDRRQIRLHFQSDRG